MKSNKPLKSSINITSGNKPLIGFIGQGFVGKAYADDFEARGFEIVRYSLEEQYRNNKDKIKFCDFVFIAVPTPTTPDGFTDSIIRDSIKLVGKEKVAIIKSTIVPGTTLSIQKENPDIFVLHSPEFLREVTAKEDAANPERNIIGIPECSTRFKKTAEQVLNILPKAEHSFVVKSDEAELVKYAGNCFFYFKIIFANLFHDFAYKNGIDWQVVKNLISADSRIGPSHLEPVHKSGRGAGGHCFIKDFAAFETLYSSVVGDISGEKVFESLRNKNIHLLVDSDKDLDLLEGVYGKKFLEVFKKRK